MKGDILAVRRLGVSLRCGGKPVLEDVTFSLASGRVLGVVGASGSGKTTLGLALLRLLPAAMQISGGDILIGREDVLSLDSRGLCRLRGGLAAMVFQEPRRALDPVYTIGEQIRESVLAHASACPSGRPEELLVSAGISDPRRVAASYPHELSGGLLQRAMVAIALAGSPRLLIADEPTSSLDVRMQARVMDLFMRLKEQLQLSLVLVSHDLALVRHFADEILVLKDGRITERCSAAQVGKSRDPYTVQLLEAGGL